MASWANASPFGTPAFTTDTDDVRDSAALEVVQKLHELGAIITVTEPRALVNARKAHPGSTTSMIRAGTVSRRLTQISRSRPET
ncbi:UDP binding domain-containing protein [Streptomyces xanthochromogenes]|uniref:UDP binding domain-containing protein n=1 Tax=Streptomyces xanthochromogenes TaxID=67384 RepID=UPI0037FCF306